MSRDKSKHISVYKKLGSNIRAIRESRKISQEELAFKVSSARNYIGCIERAEKYPSLAIILDIAEALNCSPIDLFKNI